MHNPAHTTIGRAGQAGAAQGTERQHTLVVLVQDRPGSVDRVVGLLRRRRANMQTLVLSRGTQTNEVRITTSVSDSDVSVEHLVEQIRKVIDVTRVTNLVQRDAITRELALIRVNATWVQVQEVVAQVQGFSAQSINEDGETVAVQVAGNTQQIDELLERLSSYGIREVARSGSVAISRMV